ncbi:MAG: signal peptidase I [Neisseria sp.]|nr:signal peptidase I [Neisseria sp.]
MSEKMFFISIMLFVLGAGAYAISDKERNLENDEWPGMLQWGYLMMMIGVFGVLAHFMSFTAVLLIFTVFTFAVWLWDKKNRKAAGKERAHEASGHFVDYMSGFFPIILVVFVLRTFVAEPFVIPSSSMRPGLVPGDFVLVNKFAYGIRIPIANNVLIPTGEVERGDVAVFNYPKEPAINYIKRIVGVPGDVVEYHNKILKINGETVTGSLQGENAFMTDIESSGAPYRATVNVYREQIGTHGFDVFHIPAAPTLNLAGVDNPDRQACDYRPDGFTCTVPEGKYFAMGDNRDNSADSRYWGFVDDQLMVGKAWMVWMNFAAPSRIGTKIQ